MSIKRAALAGAGLLAVLALAGTGSPIGAQTSRAHHYRVTLVNLTNGQPFSPPAAATHGESMHMFQVGEMATDELAAIAQDGNEMPMFNLFNGSNKVTQAVDVGKPLTPSGKQVMDFTDTVTFDITGRQGDKFSLATMLICTNDGFLGIDAVDLPARGAMTQLFLAGYKAGREQNTEMSRDIVDPCSDLGPAHLRGDPNGNRDAEVALVPNEPIRLHPGIQGRGDLDPAIHGWTDPVAKLTIVQVD